MTYTESASKKWGFGFVPAWKRGWHDCERGIYKPALEYSEHAVNAYKDGYKERRAINQAWGRMLVSA